MFKFSSLVGRVVEAVMKKLVLVVVVVGITTLGFSQEVQEVQEGVIFSTFFANVANVSDEQVKGSMFGFINFVKGDFKGFQFLGFNINNGKFGGLQLGGVNVATSVKGAQIAGINIAHKEMKGAQIGVINVAKHHTKGIQLGIINFIDSVVNSTPLGLFNIVRHGGYRAIEYSFAEFYPVNIGYKFGVEKFYTTLFLSYNPIENIPAAGLGFGSIVPINASFFFNPELNSLLTIRRYPHEVLSLVPYFGYEFNDKISMVIGPSISISSTNIGEAFQKPFFKIMNNEIDEIDSIVVGARVGIRYRFK